MASKVLKQNLKYFPKQEHIGRVKTQLEGEELDIFPENELNRFSGFLISEKTFMIRRDNDNPSSLTSLRFTLGNLSRAEVNLFLKILSDIPNYYSSIRRILIVYMSKAENVDEQRRINVLRGTIWGLYNGTSCSGHIDIQLAVDPGHILENSHHIDVFRWFSSVHVQTDESMGQVALELTMETPGDS